MIAALYYTYVIYYLRKAASIDMELWDAKTVTPADFTV